MPANETVRKPYTSPRDIVDTTETLLTAAADTMMLADIPSGAFRPGSAMNAIEIAFTMKADGEACAAYLFAARKDGDIVLVWDGTLTAGKQEATSSRFYVDTLGSTTANWITTIKEVDIGGDDRMSRIVFDTCGYAYFFCQFTGLSSEDVQAHYSGF